MEGRQAQPLPIPAHQGARFLQRRCERKDAFAVETHPGVAHTNVLVAASQRFQRLAHTHRVRSHAQAGRQIKPVRPAPLNGKVDAGGSIDNLNRAHVVGHIPHEAFRRLLLDNARQETRRHPRGHASGLRWMRPQLATARAPPPINALNEGSHRLVREGLGNRSARARRAQLVLRPPAHDDALLVAAHRPDEGGLRGRPRIEAPVGRADHEAPAQSGQPGSAKFRNIGGGNPQGPIEGKALECGHSVETRNAPASVEDQQARGGVDAGRVNNPVPVAGHDRDRESRLLGYDVDVRVPRRV